MKIFNRWDMEGIQVADKGLQRYIGLNPVLVPRTGGRRASIRFHKSYTNIVERLMGKLMVAGHKGKKHKLSSGHNPGKTSKVYNIVEKAFDIIEKETKKNPIIVFVKAVENAAPREEITTIEYGGAKYPKAVDCGPQRRVDLALKHNLYIISDEPYQEIVFDGLSLLPFSSFKKLLPQLIVTDSVSKRFNSCGARVGCLASKNKQIISASLKFAQARLSVATVDQLAVVPLLKNHSQYVGQVRKTYQSRRDTVIAELKKIPGVSLTPPQGAFYLIPELPINDSDKFAQFLLEKFQDKKETVMVAPATGFYKTAGLGKKEIRIAYVLNEKKLVRAVELLNLALKQYNH